MDNEQAALATTKRSLDLIADFDSGFTSGWHMSLKESFRLELDIKLTERKKNKISYFEWTQGPYFCFSEGQIIYDVKEGYANCWKDSLKYVNLACQVVMGKPNIPIKIENAVTGKPEYRVLEGSVNIVIFRPDEERTKLVPFVGYHLSQNNFVRFLKTGKL